MARLKTREPKRQRGLSLPADLMDRISNEAEKYGRTWNETVELVLLRAFPPLVSDMQKSSETRPDMHQPPAALAFGMPEGE